MTYKIFASDMDGTFLDSERGYDKARFAEILKEFDKRGLIFCAASGRQMLALEEVFADFRDQIAFCAENGALVKYKGEILYSSELGAEKSKQLIGLLQKNPHLAEDRMLVSGLKGFYCLESSPQDFRDFASLYYENLQVVSSTEEIDDVFLKVCVEFPPDEIRACEDWINARMSGIRATTTGFKSIDIMSEGVSKASGLSHLLSHFDLDASHLMAFGDQMNDLEMLKLAGHAVAVSNAVPEILSLADEMIGDHQNSAVLERLEAYLKRA
ncbi:Cof-type HAD-IIB family hydrolase [Lactococcus termiticola]|uniref:Haloacid dehalogenase n=1 Tax=Lactococcus termiticola TaxID=2169526 RepID=A0A2R5HHM7_9LACT|nr:Cof-type HAD-IIB family hydrolase [Lactococcus termiticola]GBG96855.1 haloacid dehalogenase [Lactococcus termiticola]